MNKKVTVELSNGEKIVFDNISWINYQTGDMDHYELVNENDALAAIFPFREVRSIIVKQDN